MDDLNDPQESTETSQHDESEAIARLLRLAGPRPGVPSDREARLRAAAHEHWSAGLKRERRLRWAIWTGVSIAAACLLLCFAVLRGWRVLDLLQPPGSTVARVLRVEGAQVAAASDAPRAGADLQSGTFLTTGNAERMAIQMGGGAVVRLDHGTRLRLISQLAINLDAGAVYVDSGAGSGADSPLEIRTRLGIVRDVGTQFQVRVNPAGVQVSVRQGVARVERGSASHDATAGIELSLENNGSLTSRSIPTTGGEWEWILGLASSFHLEGNPLGSYLDWVARETGLRVEYLDSSVEADAKPVILHGSIDGLRPEESLKAVLPTCGMAYSIEGDVLKVSPASRENSP